MMEALPLNIPRYPMLRFVAQRGRHHVPVVAILMLVAGLAMALQTAALIAGVIMVLFIIMVLAIFVFAAGRAPAGMVELITDKLPPK